MEAGGVTEEELEGDLKMKLRLYIMLKRTTRTATGPSINAVARLDNLYRALLRISGCNRSAPYGDDCWEYGADGGWEYGIDGGWEYGADGG